MDDEGSVEVVNRQRRRSVERAHWREFAKRALRNIGRPFESVTIAFVSDGAMRKLNKDFRGHNTSTDVLSFPNIYEKFEDTSEINLGDVVISVDRAEVQAVEHELEFEEEVAQLILHGLLHLCGYDHETDNGEMNRLELRLRRQLGI